MRKWIVLILLCLVPDLIYAAFGEMSFTPVPGDKSIEWLSYVFGTVDPVLIGTGSQLLGKMFGIFNAAVLSLGGVMLIYVMFTGTLQTAHSGQMLGQKWNSVWIPIRSAAGIALLLPKASGYCMMQVLVMWLIVQGVGAADSIWGTAVNYIAAGGGIIKKNVSIAGAGGPNKANVQDYTNAAAKMLNIAVCNKALEKMLKIQAAASGNKTVPSFTGSVDFKLNSTTTHTVQIPGTFQGGTGTSGTDYNAYTGKCGTIKLDTIPKVGSRSTDNETILRNSAIAAMYSAAAGYASSYVNSGVTTDTSNTGGGGITGGGFGTGSSPNAKFNRTNAKNTFALEKDSGGTTWSTELALLGLEYFTTYKIILDDVELAGSSGSGGLRDSWGGSVSAKKLTDRGWALAGVYFFYLARAASAALDTMNQKSLDANVSFVPGETNAQYYLTAENQAPAAIRLNTTGDTLKINEANRVLLYNMIAYPGNPAAPGACASLSKCYLWNDFDRHAINNTSVTNVVSVATPGGTSSSSETFDPTPITVTIGVLFTILGVAIAFALGPLSPAALGLIPGLVKMGVGIGLLLHAEGSLINPIVAAGILGNGMIDFAIGAWIAGTMAAMLISLPMFSIPCSALGGTTITTTLWFMPFFLLLLTMFLTGGTMLAYYIPLIPFFIFIFGVLGWFFAVLEGMVAAPVVALGVMHPEGHEVVGQAQPAIMLFVNVFLRPSMMIIGFIAATILSFIVIWMLNEGIWTVFANLILRPSNIGVGLIWAIPMMFVIYSIIMAGLLQKVFTLINEVPNKVLTYIGGQYLGTGDSSQELAGAKGSMHGAGQAMGGAMGSSVQAATQEGFSQLKAGGGGGGGGDDKGADSADIESKGGDTAAPESTPSSGGGDQTGLGADAQGGGDDATQAPQGGKAAGGGGGDGSEEDEEEGH